MSIPVSVWLGITAILGLLATLAIWARGFSRARSLAVGAFLLASPAAAVALGFSLGWPVPLIDGVTLSTGQHSIIGSKIVIGEAIYILVDRGEEQPRYFRIPWSEETAKKLQDALDERGEGGEAGIDVGPAPWEKGGKSGKNKAPGEPQQGDMDGGVEANPFEWSWDQHAKQFWSKPQPKVMPDKLQEGAPAPKFENI